ncbi:SpoIIE family protein phosphatase [Streptomyces sp. NPDC052721]|uniref:SpoIIE family protein phosphatase n=1 Tax=Streptomyces sp. NPDC052721 TaxID=3154955 RepID=UPI00341BF73D
MVDEHGLVARWSPDAERLLGYPEDAILGHSALDLLVGPAVTDGLPGPSEDLAVVLRHRDGSLLKCRLAVRPERLGEAGRRGWAVTLAAAEQAGTEGMEGALLETLFTLSPMGLFLLDPQLRLVRFNPAAEGMQGTSVEEAIGKRPTEVWPGFAVETVEQHMEQVLSTGQPVIGIEKCLRPPGDPRHEHFYSASLFRLEDAHGRILGIADATVDVTDRHLAHERLTVLARSSIRIGATLDVLDNARGLAEVAVPVPADGVAVDVLEGVLTGADPEAGPLPYDAVLRRAASRSRDDGPAGVIVQQDATALPEAAVRALVGPEPVLVDPLSAPGREILCGMRRPEEAGEEVHSLMLAPLVAQGRALGLAAFCRWGDRRPFESDDLTLVAQLARQTAECLDNARRHLREHNSLIALQHVLRPGRLPSQQALEIAHAHISAGAGGDWVDAVPLSGARVALVAGRVPGRGIQPAAAAGRLRAAVHTLSDLDLEPDELLARLDDMIRGSGNVIDNEDLDDQPPWAQGTVSRSHSQECGATCLYLIYDPVSRSCSASTAGHPWPLVVGPDGSVRTIDGPVADTLCCPGGPFSRQDFALAENSTLILYTPGLLQQEQTSGILGQERLTTLLAASGSSVQATCKLLTDALVPARPRDDVAVLVARTHAMGPADVASWDLRSVPATVATARSLTTRKLLEWDMSEAAFTAELIVSELVTNAIRHGKPPVRLRLVRSHVLTCEVSDGSSTSPRLRHARISDENGRGLLLVARCSDRWGTRYTDDGKIVWAEPMAV